MQFSFNRSIQKFDRRTNSLSSRGYRNIMMAGALLLSLGGWVEQGFLLSYLPTAACSLGMLSLLLYLGPWLADRFHSPLRQRAEEEKVRQALTSLTADPAYKPIAVTVKAPSRLEVFFARIAGVRSRRARSEDGKLYHVHFRGNWRREFKAQLYVLSDCKLHSRYLQRHAIVPDKKISA